MLSWVIIKWGLDVSIVYQFLDESAGIFGAKWFLRSLGASASDSLRPCTQQPRRFLRNYFGTFLIINRCRLLPYIFKFFFILKILTFLLFDIKCLQRPRPLLNPFTLFCLLNFDLFFIGLLLCWITTILIFIGNIFLYHMLSKMNSGWVAFWPLLILQ